MNCSTPRSVAGNSRLASLDLLRLLAVVMVIGHHFEEPPSELTGPLMAGIDAWMNCGGFGVDLFFVLSGFLVSGLLFAEYKKYGELSIKRFYARRAWKIYPAFYFLIAFTYFYQLLVVGRKMLDRPLFSEVAFIQSYQAGFWNHTWTLAVEEHFYVLLPLLLLLLTRRNPRAPDPFRVIPYLVMGCSLLLLGARIVNFSVRDEFSFCTHVFPSHLRMDALFFGVAIGHAFHFRSDWFVRVFQPWRYVLLLSGTGLLLTPALYAYSDFVFHTFGFTQRYLGSAAILVGLMMCQIPRNRLVVGLAALGSYSYSIYLWHMAIYYWAFPHLREAGVSWQMRSAIFLVGAFVIGIAMAKLIELPVLKFRDRWFPSRSGNAVLSEQQEAEITAPARQAA
jgi:peptidoglycan/LPS O-acetylase OafA/YrhL